MSSNSRWLAAPPSAHTVRVRLIKDIGLMSIPSALFLEPVAEGHEVMNGADTAYLVENESLGKKAIFDLGTRKDWWNLPPKVRDPLGFCVGVKVDKDVPEILEEKGLSPHDINDVIWSHSHLDHRGDMSRFPAGTTLNYGKEIAALKAADSGESDATFLASDFAGRRNNEIDFGTSTFKIGGFPALDFYGDGSFYLLDTPGHDHGHLSGLARTTSRSAGHEQDSFILIAGDTCHFCGVLRPNVSHPFPTPKHLESAIGVWGSDSLQALLKRHPQFLQPSGAPATTAAERSSVTPWYGISTGQYTTFADPVAAQTTADKVKEAFDEASNVFVALCHDMSLFAMERGKPVLPTLNDAPEDDLNGWYGRGWKEKLYWSWVAELGREDESGKIAPHEHIVTGFWKNGKKYEKAQELFEAAAKE